MVSAVLSQQFYDDLSPATDKRLHTIIHRKSENDNLRNGEIRALVAQTGDMEAMNMKILAC